MGVIAAMVALSWRRLRRDPLGLAFTFLVPIAVASVMAGIYVAEDSGGRAAPVGVVTETDGLLATDLVDRLERSSVMDVRRYQERDDLERAVRLREVAAGVVVPARVGADGTGPDNPIELVGPPEIATPNGVRAAVDSAVAETAAALQLGRTLVTESSTDVALQAGMAALAEATPEPSNITASEPSESRRQNESVAWALVATLVLFVFMNTMAGASELADYRELGILARSRTTRASSVTIAVGYGAALTSYALVQALLMLATGWLVFGVVWASWPALLIVVAAVALAAGGLGVVAGTLLPSPESGATIAGPVGFLLGGLGGALWPLEIVGPTLDFVGHLVPHAWAVEALRTTGVSGDGIGDVVTPLAVLVASAALLLLIGSRRVWRIAERA